MRIAALYDIHGNLPALEAVLVDVAESKPDVVLIGGDVFPGPLAEACLDRIGHLNTAVRFVRGNGDREVLATSRGSENAHLPEIALIPIRWHASRLCAEVQREIARWPTTVEVEHPALGRIVFCHATPADDSQLFTERTPSFRLPESLLESEAKLIICGHTHMQFDRTIEDTRIINAGSVGMPFGRPGAYWLLIDQQPKLRKTAYDLEQAAERIRMSSYPQAEDFAARGVLQPPSAEQMLAVFEPDGAEDSR